MDWIVGVALFIWVIFGGKKKARGGRLESADIIKLQRELLDKRRWINDWMAYPFCPRCHAVAATKIEATASTETAEVTSTIRCKNCGATLRVELDQGWRYRTKVVR